MNKPQTIIEITRIDIHDNVETVSKQETGMSMRAVELIESFAGLLMCLGWGEKAVHDAVFEFAEAIDPNPRWGVEAEHGEPSRPFWRLLNEGEAIDEGDEELCVDDDGGFDGWRRIDSKHSSIGHAFGTYRLPLRRLVK